MADRAADAPDLWRRPVTMAVNGHVRTMTIEPRTTLLEALREVLG
jgi:aerobic-type carbon monoxide dehydrogenase small subunit (CoxS/CutS family)